MADSLKFVKSITAHKTTDQDMGAPKGVPEKMTPSQAIDYLHAHPSNALVIVDFEPLVEPDAMKIGLQVAVFRGASYEVDNFYYQPLPLEEPDAEGGDLCAYDALAGALDCFTS